jgi:hypothetical protein
VLPLHLLLLLLLWVRCVCLHATALLPLPHLLRVGRLLPLQIMSVLCIRSVRLLPCLLCVW